MHIKSLKIFCEIVQRRSFSRAAAACSISQSSASQIIHQLEERLGVLLIDRSTRPFELTAEGSRFYDGCQELVQQYEKLESDVRAIRQGAHSRLTVAAIYSVGLAHMNRYLSDFLSHHPQVDVRMEYMHPHRVVEAVENGDADLGLVSYPKKTSNLTAIPWRSEPFVIVSAPDHPFSFQQQLSLEALDGEAIVAFESGLVIRDELDRELAGRNISVDVALEFDNIETIKRAIEIGAGVGLLPEPTVGREVAAGTLVAVPLRGKSLTRPLGILHRRDRKQNPVVTDFIDLLRTQGNHQDTLSRQPETPSQKTGI